MIEPTDTTPRSMEELQARAEHAEDTEQALHIIALDVLTVLADDDPTLLDSHHDMTREFMRLWAAGDQVGAMAAMDKWYMDTFGY